MIHTDLELGEQPWLRDVAKDVTVKGQVTVHYDLLTVPMGACPPVIACTRRTRWGLLVWRREIPIMNAATDCCSMLPWQLGKCECLGVSWGVNWRGSAAASAWADFG